MLYRKKLSPWFFPPPLEKLSGSVSDDTAVGGYKNNTIVYNNDNKIDSNIIVDNGGEYILYIWFVFLG